MTLPLFSVGHVVDVLAAIVPVLHRPRFPMSPKLFEIEVVDNDSFYIGIAFGCHRVTRKLRISRREDSRLSVVDISIFYKRIRVFRTRLAVSLSNAGDVVAG